MSTENKYQFKGTQGEWHPVEYSGFWDVQDKPYYDAKRLLFYDRDYEMKVATEEEAKANAHLAAAAPELLQACIEAYKELQFHNWHNTKTGFELTAAIHKALNIQE